MGAEQPGSLVVDHIGVLSDDLAAVRRLADLLGITIEGEERDEALGAEAVWLRVGDLRIEVLAPLGSGGGIAEAMAQGRHGVDHVALRVPDCAAALRRFRADGGTTLDEVPRRGLGGARIGFLDPDAAGGLRIELVEHRGDE